MRGSFQHTPETDALIAAAYTDGTRILTVAKRLGVSRDTIIGRARRLGLARAGRQIDARRLAWFGKAVSQGMAKARKRAAAERAAGLRA